MLYLERNEPRRRGAVLFQIRKTSEKSEVFNKSNVAQKARAES